MAIYHFQMKTLRRSEGRSATAAAAYRAGQRIEDARTGQTFDYSKRTGVLMAEVITPGGQPVDRGQLWNVAEAAEKRCNSVVAREFVVALPHELNREQQADLVKGYAQGLSERTGWAVDVAIHAPGKAGDLRNVHAHLLCTTRTIERDPAGCPVAGSKTRDWDIRSSGSVLLRSERSEWERCVNQSLEQANRMERVDCRSHAEKQTGLEPQVHLGPTAMAMERKGIQTERGDEYRRIAAHNLRVIELGRVREETLEEQAWAKQLAELETKTIWQLEKSIFCHPIRPKSVSDMVAEYPEVKKALRVLDEHTEAVKDCSYHLSQAGDDVRYAQHREKVWKEAHPRLSWLHEKGVWESKVLNSFGHEIQQKQNAVDEIKDRLKEAEKRQAEVQESLKQISARFVPEAQRRHDRQQVRYEQAQGILDQKRKDRALGLYKEPEQGRGMSR